MKILLILLLLVTSISQSQASEDYHYYHPVTVTADELAAQQGASLDSLSVMVNQNGKLSAIPFQFEEYDELGVIYLDKATGAPMVGEANVLDGDDLLVFMYRDTSEQSCEQAELGQGTLLRSLSFKQHDGDVRYACLVQNNTERSDKRYVDYQRAEGIITGDNYQYAFKPKDLGKALAYRLGDDPANGSNVYNDSLFELKTSVFIKLIRFTFNNKRNIKLKPVAHFDGPVRAPIVVKSQSTFLGIPVFKMYTQFNVYDHAMNVPGIEINKLRMKRLIKNLRRAARYLLEPEVRFFVEFQNLDLASIQIERTTRDTQGYGLIDGEYNEYELAMINTPLPGQWLSHRSNQWHILTTSAIPEEILDLDGLNPQVLFVDDKRDDKLYPNIGFSLKGENIALDELAKALKIADKLFKRMKPESLDELFLAIIDGHRQQKPFIEVLEEQQVDFEELQKMLDIFQFDVDMHSIAKLIDSGAYAQDDAITLGDFLDNAGIEAERAAGFMSMFRLNFNPEQSIDDLPAYTASLLERLYQGYRDKLKNGITVWTPLSDHAVNADQFSLYLNNPPRLQPE